LADLGGHHRPDPEAADRLSAKISAESGVWVASRSRLARTIIEVIRGDLVRLGGWMALAMGLLIWLIERRWRTVLAIVLPPVLALGWAFGVLGWCGVPLTPFSVLSAAFVAGIGLDNAVFLAAPGERSHHLPPVLGCTLTAMLGVGSLIGSSSPILNTTGLTLVAGLVACLIACLVLTPLLLEREPTHPPHP
jgi:predicted exporter